jgi:hypothetical protein
VAQNSTRREKAQSHTHTHTLSLSLSLSIDKKYQDKTTISAYKLTRSLNSDRSDDGIETLLTTYPMVVMKLGVNESSEKRSNKQLLPTPESRQQQRTEKFTLTC